MWLSGAMCHCCSSPHVSWNKRSNLTSFSFDRYEWQTLREQNVAVRPNTRCQIPSRVAPKVYTNFSWFAFLFNFTSSEPVCLHQLLYWWKRFTWNQKHKKFCQNYITWKMRSAWRSAIISWFLRSAMAAAELAAEGLGINSGIVLLDSRLPIGAY